MFEDAKEFQELDKLMRIEDLFVILLVGDNNTKENCAFIEESIAENIVLKKVLAYTPVSLANLLYQLNFCEDSYFSNRNDNENRNPELKVSEKHDTFIAYFYRRSSYNGVNLEKLEKFVFRANECVLNLLLNPYDQFYLSHGKPMYDINLTRMVQDFRNKIKQNSLKPENFLIDSSAVMAAFGIRKVSDLDYLSVERPEMLRDLDDNVVENHKDCLYFHSQPIEELVFNPRNYFYCYGLKFINLDTCRKFKLHRGQKKDLIDVELIDAFYRHIEDGSNMERAKTKYYIWHSLQSCTKLLKKSHARIVAACKKKD